MLRRTHQLNLIINSRAPVIGMRLLFCPLAPGGLALNARHALSLVPGRMVRNGVLTNGDVARSSTQAGVGAISEMVSLVCKIADLGRIVNAQWQLGGKAKTPFSVRLRGRAQLSGCGLRRGGAR